MMKFASIGSGSAGNGLVVRNGVSALMIDCGFSTREAEHRLARVGMTPADLDAVLVTHEHGDHSGGVSAFARKHAIPVHTTAGTAKAAKLTKCDLRVLRSEEPVTIGSFTVMPVTVPHDAREPCQFVVSVDGRSLGVLTDLGSISNLVRKHYTKCDALVLEFNHDNDMLQNGPYPYGLKKRIGGPWGHLNNNQAMELLAEVNLEGVQHLVAAHLSEQNNCPDKVRSLLSEQVRSANNLVVADQDTGFDWLEII